MYSIVWKPWSNGMFLEVYLSMIYSVVWYWEPQNWVDELDLDVQWNEPISQVSYHMRVSYSVFTSGINCFLGYSLGGNIR